MTVQQWEGALGGTPRVHKLMKAFAFLLLNAGVTFLVWAYPTDPQLAFVCLTLATPLFALSLGASAFSFSARPFARVSAWCWTICALMMASTSHQQRQVYTYCRSLASRGALRTHQPASICRLRSGCGVCRIDDHRIVFVPGGTRLAVEYSMNCQVGDDYPFDQRTCHVADGVWSPL